MLGVCDLHGLTQQINELSAAGEHDKVVVCVVVATHHVLQSGIQQQHEEEIEFLKGDYQAMLDSEAAKYADVRCDGLPIQPIIT